MPEPLHELELPGCTPEPLMGYLKALGVLRLVSEQSCSMARGRWASGAFVLHSALDEDRLLRFFLTDYAPTPIIAPWAGGSGFFAKDNRKYVEAIALSRLAPLEDYRVAIASVRRILEEQGLHDKPTDAVKTSLLQQYRRELGRSVVDWMDAAMVLQPGGQSFAPLLGTGGNDGRLDFTQNFMSRLLALGIVDGSPHERSGHWLRSALFGDLTELESASVGQFSPGRAGGANASQGLEGDPTDNPWDYVLMLEGSLVLAGAAVRRLRAGAASRASFPFTVRSSAAGYASAGESDATASRGEIWLPLWSRPTTLPELRMLFGEGRATVSSRPARDGVDFARAAATLGVDRGIGAFSRYAFLKRTGKAYLAAPLGRFEVRERTEVDLLWEIDPWLDAFRRTAGSQEAPQRFRSALRGIDQAVFDLCRYGGRSHSEAVLIALGRAERELATTQGKVGQSKATVRPLAGLSRGWIARADDSSAEFAVAVALAALHDAADKVGPLRANLEPVTVGRTRDRKAYARWAEKDRAVVWNRADLPGNLANVLTRRVMDGARVGCENLPLESHSTVRTGHIASFILGDLDDARIENLLWGLVLVDASDRQPKGSPADTGDAALPRAYALLKLLFLQRPLVIDRRDGGTRFRARLARRHEQGSVRVRPEPSTLALLCAGRLGEACAIAMRRLRASGLAPLPHSRAGRVRDHDWLELDRMGEAGVDPMRLAAALLIPISGAVVDELVHLATRGHEMQEDQTHAIAAMTSEGDTPS